MSQIVSYSPVLLRPAIGRRLRSGVAALVTTSAIVAAAHAQGNPPALAVGKMTMASGFDVRLVASEPMMAQPVCIEFDDRGRLWVVQYLQYPNPAGLKRVRVDRYSRTVYDKVPDPPPRGPRGADRITILEDSDGDAVADRSHDFVNGLNLATSIAFGHGGVFVLQPPYLLYYPDRDGDDAPDSDPEVRLSGFGIEDAQSFANSLIWGPDGWLYGCQGSTVTARVRGIEFQQAIWRYHPVSKRFELFTEGGGNMWGLDYDRDGEFFASTNGGGGAPGWSIDAPPPFPGRFVNFRVIHMVPGAYYAKSFAKHGELHNPYAFGYFERVPASNYRGLHVTPGATIYQGDSFPEEFRGRFVTNDLLEHTVQWSALEPWGTTYKGRYDGHLLVANDTWFAPSDTTPGPDGAVYIADWSDQRMSHPDPDAEWDRSNGRVYRIQWSRAPARSAAASFASVVKAESMAKLSSQALVELLAHPNNWFVRKARRILSERRDPGCYRLLQDIIAPGGDSQLALEAFWTLYGSGGADESYLQSQLKHASPRIRRWAVRLLGDQERIEAATGPALIALAENEPDAKVRSQLAATAGRLSSGDGLRIVQKIALQDRDADDPFIPLLAWWALERHAVAALDLALTLYNTPETWGSAFARKSIIPRLLRRYAAEGSNATLQACAAILAARPVGVKSEPLFTAFEQGLRQGETAGHSTRIEELPPGLARQLTGSDFGDAREDTVIGLLAWLGHEPARQRAFALADNAASDPTVRAKMILAWSERAGTADAPRLLRWLNRTEPEAVRIAAVESLRPFDSGEIARQQLVEYPRLEPTLRAKVRAGLLSRKGSARILLEHIEAGGLSAREVPAAEVRAVGQFGDSRLDQLVRKHWGKIDPTPEDKLAIVRRFNNDLSTVRDKPPGNAAHGHELFRQLCAACHGLHGEGGGIGPDLTTANRRDQEFLLVSLVDPSAVIRKEFLNYRVTTNDGRVLSGVVTEEPGGILAIAAAGNERTTVSREKIVSMQDSAVSLMPEGLLNDLTPQQRRDLFAYLQSDAPPPKAR